MKVIELDNFIDDELCNFFVNYHKNNFDLVPFKKIHRDTKVIDLMPFIKSMDNFRYLYSKISSTVFNVDNRLYPDYMEIVRWPINSFQEEHKDMSYKHYTTILYLNDDFEGGETIIGDKICKPKKGKLIGFPGNHYAHKVSEIKNGERFTIPAWFKLWEDKYD